MLKQKKFISLKTKTILLLLSVFFFMFVGTTGILSTVMLHRFETIEKTNITDHMTRTQNTIQEKIDRLEKIAFDWGVWDDTYAFIEDNDQKYHDANLVDDVFTNLDISAMIFLDAHGQVVHAESQNRLTGALEAPSAALLEFVNTNPILQNQNPGLILKGIITLPEGAMLISSSPILPSDANGVIKGNILMAFLVDDTYIEQLQEQLKLNITLETLNQAKQSNTVPSQPLITITTLDRNHIQATSTLVDLFGNPAITILINTTRETFNVGQEGVFLAGTFIFIISSICIVILSLFMNMHFLTKLEYITSTVDQIGTNKDFSIRLTKPISHDEFSIVVEEINGMLDDLESVHKENKFNAHHDTLTGLPNRRLLSELMIYSLSRSQREKTKVAVLFLDLDDFKIINDTRGHDVGDEILKSVANRLSGSLRKSDVLARIGGDEFIVLIENIDDLAQVKATADKILACFKEAFIIKESSFTVSTSIGIALYPENGKEAATLIKNADLALYQAKKIGKSQYTFSSIVVDPEQTKS